MGGEDASMEITTRSLWTLIHGMGFGGLYLLACSGALVETYRRYFSVAEIHVADGSGKFLRNYLIGMAVLAWLTVLSGAYVVYPWYRAIPPAGTSDLTAFPQMLLQSSPSTRAWHSVGMEWKEHVSWLAPIAITMAATVVGKYSGSLGRYPQLRTAVLCFVLVSLLAAAIAGVFGAEIEAHAPVMGGATIRLVHGEQP
jgi:hypothetical membrane protein